MKLIATMMLTVDGVYQGPGAPTRTGAAGSTAAAGPRRTPTRRSWPFLTALFERADALLLGRQTWEIWEPYWPHHDAGDPVSHGINVLPKYVPSTTLKDPTWQNTHVIDGDVEAAVRELKAKPGRELQVHGSGDLLRWLLERDLVDELNLRIYPVVVGDGLRLFPEHGQTHDLTLVESRSTPSGVTLQTYRPAGRATFGSAPAEGAPRSALRRRPGERHVDDPAGRGRGLDVVVLLESLESIPQADAAAEQDRDDHDVHVVDQPGSERSRGSRWRRRRCGRPVLRRPRARSRAPRPARRR